MDDLGTLYGQNWLNDQVQPDTWERRQYMQLQTDLWPLFTWKMANISWRLAVFTCEQVWARRSLSPRDTTSLETSLINVSFVVLLLILNQRWRIQSKNIVRTNVYQGNIVLFLEFWRPSFSSEYLLVFFGFYWQPFKRAMNGWKDYLDTLIPVSFPHTVCFFPLNRISTNLPWRDLLFIMIYLKLYIWQLKRIGVADFTMIKYFRTCT